MLATELYAISQGKKCIGKEECHWCGAPCGRDFVHDDPPFVVGVRREQVARRPANPFICHGCWLWRRKRLTINWLGGGQKDGQTPRHHSWWITEAVCWGIDLSVVEQKNELYNLLLQPPSRFVLALVTEQRDNWLQLTTVNDTSEVTAGTILSYTINGIPHAYTVYELQEALLNGPGGKEPGVQALVRLLGPAPKGLLPQKDRKDGRGRPPALEDAKSLRKKVG